MNRTFTPPLGPAVLERLAAYAERFRPHFNHPRQALWSGVYLRGLIQEGERKSIEPLSRRVSLPADLATVADPEQALQQFVNQSSSRRSGRGPAIPGDDGRSLGRPRRGLFAR
jgi:SRSO17 transposase